MYQRAEKVSKSSTPVTAPKTSEHQNAVGHFSVQSQIQLPSQPQTADSSFQPELQKYNPELVDLIAIRMANRTVDPAFSGNAIQRMMQNSTFGPLVVQTKLTIGEPGDQYEQEADRMASVVMSMPDSAVQRTTSTETQIHKKALSRNIPRVGDNFPRRSGEMALGLVQRMRLNTYSRENAAALSNNAVREITPAQIEIKKKARDLILQTSRNRNTRTGKDIETQLHHSQGGGNPLSTEVRGYMEPRFDADFSQVRVHTGEQAVQMNQDLGAQAFTHGSDIYYGEGKTPGVNELTAHELTHVVQQTGGIHLQEQTSHPNSPAPLENQAKSKSNVDAARDVAAGAGGIAEYEAILRTIYQRANEAIAAEAKLMISKGISSEEVARWGVEARNQVKIKVRKWDLDVLRLMAERSNINKYGHPVGPSYKDLRYGKPSHRIRPRPDEEILSSVQSTRGSVNRWVGTFRIAGRILIAINIGIAAWNVATAPEVDRPKVLLEEVGGLGGAIAGGLAGARIGGIGGAVIGPEGSLAGTIIGGFGGSILGGIGGGWGGRLVAEQLYPPQQTNFEGRFQ